jgi:hypothetical protein
MTKDSLSRIGWTTLQVGIPAIAYYVGILPAQLVPVGTVALAVIKNLVADHYNTKESAE